MYPGGKTGVLTVKAPAKLNLTLEVLGNRPDGFHEIRSVVQTINLYDSLLFYSNQNIELRCDKPDWTAEESLISKTAKLLQKTAGCSKGVTIEINERIPMLAGLGGDSSGAAATLRGLNKLWELGLSPQELISLAAQLGSDVAFFLYGGTALLKGRGEIVTALPSLLHRWVVLMVPLLPRTRGKTKRLYTSLKASHYTEGQITNKLVALLANGEEVAPANLFNVFESVAFDSFSGLREYWKLFLKAGAHQVHLAGSGPALFTLVKDKGRAEEIHQRLQQEGLESYLTETLTALAQLE
jgi:4-diphosphocytidyl-2-C-methyl-D-erythritol kinase